MSGEYVGWVAPPGVAVVAPPCHVETEVDLLFSDRSELSGVRAGSQNWSSVGDGPSVVAYAVVEEYKEPPKVAREWWLTPSGFAYVSHEVAGVNGEQMSKLIHVREVPDPSREVTAWSVVKGDTFRDHHVFYSQSSADAWAAKYGGTVVKLTGVMP